MEPETLTKDFRKQMMLTELVDDLRTRVDDYLKLGSELEDATASAATVASEPTTTTTTLLLEEESRAGGGGAAEEDDDAVGEGAGPVMPLVLPLAGPHRGAKPPKEILVTWWGEADDALMANQLVALFVAVLMSQLARRRFHTEMAASDAKLRHSTVSSVSLLLVSTISGFLVFLLFEMTNPPHATRPFTSPLTSPLAFPSFPMPLNRRPCLS